MTGVGVGVVSTALVVVWALVAALLVATGLVHVVRVGLARRRRRGDDIARPMVSAYALGEQDAEERLRRASGLLGDRVDERLLALLDVLSGESRQRLVDMLVERGHPQRLRRRLGSPFASTRAAAVRRLGSLGLPEDGELLTAALGDRSPIVRSVASRALASYPSRRVVERVLMLVREDREVPVLVLVNALLALGERNPVCCDAIREGMRSSSPRVRAACAKTVGLLTSVADAARVARLLYTDPDPMVQLACANALTRIGTGASVPALRMGLDSPWPQVRAECQRALRALPKGLSSPAVTAIEADPLRPTLRVPAVPVLDGI